MELRGDLESVLYLRRELEFQMLTNCKQAGATTAECLECKEGQLGLQPAARVRKPGLYSVPW